MNTIKEVAKMDFVSNSLNNLQTGYSNSRDSVEEKFHKENFRVLSEMPILAKIRVVILDFVGYVDFFSEIWCEIWF